MTRKYTYQGEAVQVQTPSSNAYLVQIGDRIVRVKKRVEEVKKWPKLRLVK